MKYLLNCPLNTAGQFHSKAACWRNTEIFIHLNSFLCDCTLASFGELAKTLFVLPRNHSLQSKHSNYWNILLTGTSDFMGMNYYTSELGEDGVEGGNPSRGRDMGTILSKDPNWPESASSWLRVSTFSYFPVHPHIYLFISSPLISLSSIKPHSVPLFLPSLHTPFICTLYLQTAQSLTD